MTSTLTNPEIRAAAAGAAAALATVTTALMSCCSLHRDSNNDSFSCPAGCCKIIVFLNYYGFFCSVLRFQEAEYVQHEFGLFSESARCLCWWAANSELCQRCSSSSGKSRGHLNIQPHPRKDGGGFLIPLAPPPHATQGERKWQSGRGDATTQEFAF